MRNKFNILISYSIVPVIFIGTIPLYSGLRTFFSPELSLILTAFTNMLVIILLELVVPENKEWAMTKTNFSTGFSFVVSNAFCRQIAEYLLVVTLYSALSNTLVSFKGVIVSFSPVVQAFVLLLVIDFLMYAWHVLEHKYYVLWKLHAVHHSSQKYHTLINSYGHPISAIIKAVFILSPALLLGVSKEVITLTYLIKYAHTWLIHANLDIKFGPLKYVMVTTKFHKIHHSEVIKNSNSNYGFRFIIWDFLFGTLSGLDKTIRVVGCCEGKSHLYPQNFSGLLKLPFKRIP